MEVKENRLCGQFLAEQYFKKLITLGRAYDAIILPDVPGRVPYTLLLMHLPSYAPRKAAEASMGDPDGAQVLTLTLPNPSYCSNSESKQLVTTQKKLCNVKERSQCEIKQIHHFRS